MYRFAALRCLRYTENDIDTVNIVRRHDICFHSVSFKYRHQLIPNDDDRIVVVVFGRFRFALVCVCVCARTRFGGE